MFNANEHHLIKVSGKRAFERGWPDHPLSPSEYNDWRGIAGNGIGVVCGGRGDLYCVDVDEHEAAAVVLLHWELPPTLLVETSHNKFHFIFRYTGPKLLKRRIRAYPGIDLLGAGGYFALHEPLDRYKPEHIAEMPEVLIDAWVDDQNAAEPAQVAQQALPGNRNDTFTALAGIMRRQGMPAAQIERELQLSNLALPVPMQGLEVTGIAASVARYDQEKVPRIDDGLLQIPFESFGDLCARADVMTTPEPVIGQFITSSWGIIAGEPGAGKSLMAAQLARAMACGTKFCDWMPSRPFRVALIDAEMTPDELRDRIGAAEIPNLVVNTLDLMERQGRDALGIGGDQLDQNALMRSLKNAEVIILDNIEYCLEPAPDRDIYHAETWKRVHPLLSWAKSTGKLLILIDHTNRAGQVAGSLSKQRGASFVITVKKAWRQHCEHALEWHPGKCRYRTDAANRKQREFWVDQDGQWSNEIILNKAEEIIAMIEAGSDLKTIRREMKGICSTEYCRKIFQRVTGKKA